MNRPEDRIRDTGADPGADCEKADVVAWLICLTLGMFFGVVIFFWAVGG